MSDDNHEPSIKPDKMAAELENRILKVIDEVDSGFRKVMAMYIVAFYAGLGLIALSVTATLFSGNDYFYLLFGGVGIVDVVAFFIFKPVEDLQRSRGNLGQLVSAFVTWYNDIHNWNQVLAKELAKDNCDMEVCKEVSRTSMLNTIAIISAIEIFVASKLTDDVSEKLKAVIDDFDEKTDGTE